MGPSHSPSPVAVLSTAAYEHHYPSSPDDEDYYEDDDFEFRPLLPRRQRSARAERPRTVRRVTAHACTLTKTPSRRARRAPSVAKEETTTAPPRRVRWHHMAFGSVRVPAAMDMGEIRRRLKSRQELAGAGNEPSSAGWAPWRLIRSLSCKGVEVVAAAAAPVRLV